MVVVVVMVNLRCAEMSILLLDEVDAGKLKRKEEKLLEGTEIRLTRSITGILPREQTREKYIFEVEQCRQSV